MVRSIEGSRAPRPHNSAIILNAQSPCLRESQASRVQATAEQHSMFFSGPSQSLTQVVSSISPDSFCTPTFR